MRNLADLNISIIYIFAILVLFIDGCFCGANIRLFIRSTAEESPRFMASIDQRLLIRSFRRIFAPISLGSVYSRLRRSEQQKTADTNGLFQSTFEQAETEKSLSLSYHIIQIKSNLTNLYHYYLFRSCLFLIHIIKSGS